MQKDKNEAYYPYQHVGFPTQQKKLRDARASRNFLPNSWQGYGKKSIQKVWGRFPAPKGYARDIAMTQESGFYSPLFPHAALKILAIRTYSCAFCLALGKIGCIKTAMHLKSDYLRCILVFENAGWLSPIKFENAKRRLKNGF
ncbi:MAG: hypothetical protein IJI67_06840 [Clostridia bacterium]|nr:hypothetical protein [Clostridia bacterium]